MDFKVGDYIEITYPDYLTECFGVLKGDLAKISRVRLFATPTRHTIVYVNIRGYENFALAIREISLYHPSELEKVIYNLS